MIEDLLDPTSTTVVTYTHYARIAAFKDLNTTTVNQVLGLPGLFSTFNAPQLRKLRISAISASVASIFACIIGLYLLTSIDRRRKVFRHHLIFYLLVCDFLKAIVLLIYPVVILRHNEIYGTPAFYNTVGWLTAYAIEGADIAIFVFALHFAILIFKPNWKWRNNNTGNLEGGFFKWRKFIYPFTALTPTVLASLAFINFSSYNEDVIEADTNVVLDNNNYNFEFQAKMGGYKPLSAWCYLPPVPIWYKLVLSWVPRYFIFLTICTIYISIYVFVNRESRKIKSEIKGFQHSKDDHVNFFNRKPSLNIALNVINGSAIGIKYCFKRFVSFLRNFFFLELFDDTESQKHNLSAAGGRQRAGTPGLPSVNDLDIGLSNRYEYSPDEVDIEDGYNNNSNNGLHLFEYSNLPIASHDGSEDLNKNRKPDSLTPAKPQVAQFRQPANSYASARCPPSIPLQTSSSPNDVPNVSKHSTNTVDNQAMGTEVDIEKMEHLPGKDVTGIKHKFQSEMYAHFKNRRDQIRRQLKSIFVYPMAYLLLWLFPFIVDCSQYSYEIYNGPIVWLAYIATFMQPLNGVVDVAVFLYREQPWRYSWGLIHSKELISKYRLKGEIGEADILSMCESELGRRGWYYRGRWVKEECWKYKPQLWKRTYWYVHRTVIGLWRLDLNFEDNCLDRDYWDSYYGNHASNTMSMSTTNKLKLFPVLHQSLSSSTGSSENGIDPYKRKFKVPLMWRIFHKLPLQEGIDLDELDRYLKMKNRYDDFIIPGLQFAIDQNTSNNNNSLFKPNYLLSSSSKEKEPTSDISPSKHSSITETPLQGSLNFGNVANMNFADLTKNANLPGVCANSNQSQSSTKEEQLDLLSFLKGPPPT